MLLKHIFYIENKEKKQEKEGILPKKTTPAEQPVRPSVKPAEQNKPAAQTKFVAPRPTKRIDKDGNVIKPKETEKKQETKQQQEVQPIKRHIIPQDIYNNNTPGKRKVVKGRQKDYKSKED